MFRPSIGLLALLVPLTASAEGTSPSPRLPSLLAIAQDPVDPPNADEEAERARLEAELAAELGQQAPEPQQPGAPVRQDVLPRISLIGSFVASWFSEEPTRRLAAHEPTHRGLELQEIELALQSSIDPYFRADVFFAFSPHGVEVEEAYATTQALPANLQLRAGSFYAPFGRFNQQHFLEVTPFVDMPLPNRRFFGGEQLRGIGAEASILLPLPFFLELRASAQTADNELSFGLPVDEIDDVTDLLGVARMLTSFDFTDRLTMNLGVSAANGPNASGGPEVSGENRTDVFGADLYLHLRDRASRAYTALQAEWLYRRATVPGGRLEQGGAYAWLVRRFDARWEAAIRWDMLGGPTGRAIGTPDFEVEPLVDFLAPANQQRIGASLSHHFTEFSRLRLQANHDFGLEERGVPADAVTEVFLQFQFVIGAHGAHRF